MSTSLRFYIDGGILQCDEFKAQLTKGASCDRNVTNNYVQFSDGFLHLQPSSFLSDNLLSYLNRKTTKVTLLVSTVETEKVIEGLRPRNGSSSANAAKEFSLKFGDKKISGTNGVSGTFNLLCEANSSKDALELFQSFAPGYFPKMTVPFGKYLKGMRFRDRVKFVMGL